MAQVSKSARLIALELIAGMSDFMFIVALSDYHSRGAESDTGRQSECSEYSDLCWSFTSPSLALSFGDVVSPPRRFLAVGFRRHHHVWCALGNAFCFYRGTNDAACQE